jgi:hypothetical protein
MHWSRGSSVGMTGYGLGDRVIGVRMSLGPRIFSSPNRPDRLSSPPSLLSNGYRRLFPPPPPRGGGLKWPGSEADHWQTSAEVEKTWLYTSTLPYVFMAQCLVKHRDNFTFNFPCSVIFIQWFSYIEEWNYFYFFCNHKRYPSSTVSNKHTDYPITRE